MKYERNRDESGEILRLAIQKMAGQPAAFTPFTYAVWYEFLTGINPALSEAVNRLFENGKKLDDESIESLYAKYVSDSNMNAQLELQNNLKQLLSKLAGFTAETDKQALDFGNNLQSYGESLKQKLDPAKLNALIGNMTGDTDKMRSSMKNLKDELATSKQEVEKLHQELESARGEALTDPLTGIFNRRGFEKAAKESFENQEILDKGMCLLMMDIDHFKKVNDTYGHLFGDKVITAIASALKSKVKGQDAAGRLGGEEFAVLLPETKLEGAKVVAENIRKSIESGKIRRHNDQEPIGGITISIGISEYASGVGLIEMLDQADKALYISKESGRNRVSVYGQ